MNQKIIGAVRGNPVVPVKNDTSATPTVARVTPWMTGNMELGPI